MLEGFYIAVRTWASRGTLPLYHEFGAQSGKDYQEVVNAAKGFKSTWCASTNAAR